MFNPKYEILLTKNSFLRDEFICLGSQVICIIDYLKGLLPSHLWYGADVVATGEEVMNLDLNSTQLKLIGNDADFVQLCSSIDQFLSGVFVCANHDLPSCNVVGEELETEDPPFRSINIEQIIAEIRAFDTSYFIIYLKDKNLLNKLIEKFHPSEVTEA